MCPRETCNSKIKYLKHVFVALLLVIHILSLSGCGGGGGTSQSGANSSTTSPSNLTGKQGSSFDAIELDWIKPTVAFDGYTVEISVADGNYQSLSSDLIPNNWQGVILTFNASTPELLDLKFRVCAVRGGIKSDYSNIVSYFRGVRPASNLFIDFPRSSLLITWMKNSIVADTVHLEKAILNADGTPGTWLTLNNVSADSLAYLDHDLLEGTIYAYRITYSKGSVSSSPIVGNSPVIPISSVTAFAVASQADGIHLTWQNRSSLSTEIVVWRSPNWGAGYSTYARDIAHLSKVSTTFIDAVNSPGSYEYYLETKSASASIWSPIVAAQYQVPNAPVLSSQILTLPAASSIYQSRSGKICLSVDNNYTPGLRINNGATWDPHLALGTIWAYPYVRFDNLDNPHLVSVKRIAGTDYELIHEWYDGTSWQSEPIFTRNVLTDPYLLWPAIVFELDSAGQIHIVLDESQGSQPSTSGLIYVHKGSSGWVEESLNILPAAQYYTRFTLAVDPTNTPHVIVWTNDSNGHEVSKSSQGSWTSALIPEATGRDGAFSKLVFLSPDHALLIFSQYTTGAPPQMDEDLMCLEKIAGSWQSPQRLGPVSLIGTRSDGDIALSSDHRRVALLATASVARILYLFSGNTWIPVALTHQFIGGYGNPAVTFDGTGHVTVIGRDTLTTDNAPAPFTILKETP